MAELTLEPAETVRARLERALAAEEVNLASAAGRGRTEELIEETLRSYEAEALSGQTPALSPEERTALDLSSSADLCPNCGDSTFVRQEGCQTCFACGYSEC